MPALDACQPAVIRALQKSGWQIVNQHFRLRVPGRTAHVDIRAEQGSGNGIRRQILLSEVKCFADSRMWTQELYNGIGQYLVYQAMLDELQDKTPLYLAIPDKIYETVFEASARRAIQKAQIKLVLVNLETETIVQWL